MTTARRDDLIAALRLRYDHHSAEAVLESALARAGLAAQATYSTSEVQQLRAALARIGDRLGAVEAHLDALFGTAPAASSPSPAAAPVAKAAPPVEAAPPPVPPAEPPAVTSVETKGPSTQVVPPVAADGTVTFVLDGITVDDDAQVLVCGGGAPLGDWDPGRAVPMVRDGAAWVATLPAPPSGELAFKFLVRRAGGAIEWEAGDNRVSAPAPRVSATWRVAEAPAD